MRSALGEHRLQTAADHWSWSFGRDEVVVKLEQTLSPYVRLPTQGSPSHRPVKRSFWGHVVNKFRNAISDKPPSKK